LASGWAPFLDNNSPSRPSFLIWIDIKSHAIPRRLLDEVSNWRRPTPNYTQANFSQYLGESENISKDSANIKYMKAARAKIHKDSSFICLFFFLDYQKSLVSYALKVAFTERSIGFIST
jgi:hypothetical protein